MIFYSKIIDTATPSDGAFSIKMKHFNREIVLKHGDNDPCPVSCEKNDIPY